eukprot:1560059-Rhodomonas_salina.1
MANSGPSHIEAAKLILPYLKGTHKVGITYTCDLAVTNQLYAYVDADHAGDPEGRCSVTGYCIMMNGRAISWESKRQKDCLTPVAEDNVACIYMSKSSAMFHKGKHIDVMVRVYCLREFVQDGIMELYHVLTHQQAADWLTKSLPSEVLKKHWILLAGADNAARIPGSQVTKVDVRDNEPSSCLGRGEG